MKIQGKLSGLTKNGEVTTFLLHTPGEDVHVQSSKPLPAGVKNGDTVIVTGENPTDPPFLADSVEKVSVDPPKVPWLWIAVGGALVLVLILVVVLFSGKGNTWTIHAVDHGTAAASVPFTLMDATRTTLKTVSTDNNGSVLFTGLKNGTYYATAPGAATVSTTINGGNTLSTVAVQSPFSWTVSTLRCGRGISAQISLSSQPGGVVMQTTTDASGNHTFTNLKAGSYVATFVSGNQTAAATINGVTPPPLGRIVIQPLGPPCFIIHPGFGVTSVIKDEPALKVVHP